MRKTTLVLLTVLLAFSLLLLNSPAQAQVPWTIKAKTYTTTTANDLQDIVVYGITLLATTDDCSSGLGAALGGIYDTTTAPGTSMTDNRGELGEGTQHDFVFRVFEEPIKISNLTVSVEGGALTVYYTYQK